MRRSDGRAMAISIHFSPTVANAARRSKTSDARSTAYYVLRTGAPWRDMPERYGNWNSVYVRFSRWSKLGCGTRRSKPWH